MVVGAMMTSCSEAEKPAETNEAQEVDVVEEVEETTVNYATVKEGSYVDWRGAHLGGLQPRFGKVSVDNATVVTTNGVVSAAKVAMNMGSITVESFPEGAEEIGKLTGHLLSDDFFNTEVYPTSLFEMTEINAAEGDYNSTVSGNLTLLDVTKPISFNANVEVSEAGVSIMSEDFIIDRSDWNLTYNAEGTAGVPVDYLISDDVGFTINVSLTK